MLQQQQQQQQQWTHFPRPPRPDPACPSRDRPFGISQPASGGARLGRRTRGIITHALLRPAVGAFAWNYLLGQDYVCS